MNKQKAEILLKKYRAGEASYEETRQLLMWIQQFNDKESPEFSLADLKKVQAELSERLPIALFNQKQKQPWTKIVAAASIFFVVLGGWYFVFQNKKPENSALINKTEDVKPGVNQATLTLANGQKIILTKNLHGKIAQQGATSININSDSSIAYQSAVGNSKSSLKITYNTLTTNRGEQSPFPLVLADGTKVWLNSASSLTFPTSFDGDKREVQLEGEGYFEVAHNSKQPFLVRSGNQIVQDIGTAFNINSYGDELEIKTTLVEGSAKVYAHGVSKMLKPGEQTQVSQKNIILTKADLKSATAWLNGQFIFHDEELHDVMRKLSRWYNIEVIYNSSRSNILLGGGFSKSRNISTVLKAFEQTGAVKFKIKGRTVTVTE